MQVTIIWRRHGHGLGQSMGWVGFGSMLLFWHDFTKITGWSGRSRSISKECHMVQSQQQILHQTDATHATQSGGLSLDQTSYRGCGST